MSRSLRPTLGAALDWSYQLLPEEERAVLRRLSVFAGDFPLEAAVALAAEPGLSDIVEYIANLVGKSLVAADPRGEAPQYRLLDTTRGFEPSVPRVRDGAFRDCPFGMSCAAERPRCSPRSRPAALLGSLDVVKKTKMRNGTADTGIAT
jgi:hypothetical protein